MFQLDEKYLSEDIVTGGMIRKSGCYVVRIDEATIWKSSSGSQTESLNLTGITEAEETVWINIFYRDKQGRIIDFNNRHINHLCYLLNLNPQVNSKNEVTNLINQKIGIVVEVGKRTKNDGKEIYDYQLKGFFDPTTKQTSKEKIENQTAKTYYKLIEKYEDSEEITLNPQTSSNNNNQNNDGFFPIDDGDIPF